VAHNNQFGSGDFQKFTLAMNPNNPKDLLNSKHVESIIKSVIAASQQEGQKVMHSQRSYDENGMRMTDYYAPSRYVETARTAADDYLQVLGESVSTSMSVSSPINTPFRSQKVSILDPRKRAELARIVTENGGFFDTNKSGVTTYGLDKTVSYNGKNLSSSVIAQIASSNMRHKDDWESLVFRGSGREDSFSANTPLERSIKASAAKRALVEKQKREYTSVDEREATFAALAKRGRKFNHTAEYAKLHPDDPYVKARLMQKGGKSRMGKVAGAARIAKNTSMTLVMGILGGVMTLVGIITEMSKLLGGIGGAVQAQRRTDMKYNFADNTNLNWQRYAGAKGYDKDTISKAAAGIQQAWNNPMQYKGANFSKLAPLLGDDTANLVRMSAKDDVNILGIFDSVVDTFMKKTAAGTTATKSGLSKSEAFQQNYELLAEHNADWAQYFSDMWYDYMGETGGGVTPGNWKKDGRTVNSAAYRTQSEWATQYSTSQDRTNASQKRGAEDTYKTITESGAMFASTWEDTLKRIAASSQQLVDDFTAFAVNILKKFDLAPEVVASYNAKNRQINNAASVLLEANIKNEKADLNARLKKAGLPDIDTQEKDGPGADFGDAYRIFLSDPANAVALAAYADSQKYQKKLATELKKGSNDITNAQVYTGTSHAARTVGEAMNLWNDLTASYDFKGTNTIEGDAAYSAAAQVLGDSVYASSEINRVMAGGVTLKGIKGKIHNISEFRNAVPGGLVSAVPTGGGQSTLTVTLQSVKDGVKENLSSFVIGNTGIDTNVNIQDVTNINKQTVTSSSAATPAAKTDTASSQSKYYTTR